MAINNKAKLLKIMVDKIKVFTDIAAVGMSGGIDSTVIATLCRIALGSENVYGIHMPYNKADNQDGKFNGNSRRIANKLSIKSINAPIFDIVAALNKTVVDAAGHGMEINELGKINDGNSRSRARMCVLYGYCHELATLTNKKCRVIGTGNLSEDFIGYDTKGGDALADIFPMGDLYKSEVYELAEYLVELGWLDEDMVDRVPDSGLHDMTDEQELGYSYNEMEPSIRKIICKDWSDENWDHGIDQFVWDRHFANKHKHQAPPIVELRDSGYLE